MPLRCGCTSSSSTRAHCWQGGWVDGWVGCEGGLICAAPIGCVCSLAVQMNCVNGLAFLAGCAHALLLTVHCCAAGLCGRTARMAAPGAAAAAAGPTCPAQPLSVAAAAPAAGASCLPPVLSAAEAAAGSRDPLQRQCWQSCSSCSSCSRGTRQGAGGILHLQQRQRAPDGLSRHLRHSCSRCQNQRSLYCSNYR